MKRNPLGRRNPDAGEAGRTTSTAPDTLAALIAGTEPPAPYYAEELYTAWGDAEHEVRAAYAGWREFMSGDAYVVYVAALDREQRAAEAYAELRRSALECNS